MFTKRIIYFNLHFVEVEGISDTNGLLPATEKTMYIYYFRRISLLPIPTCPYIQQTIVLLFYYSWEEIVWIDAKSWALVIISCSEIPCSADTESKYNLSCPAAGIIA